MDNQRYLAFVKKMRLVSKYCFCINITGFALTTKQFILQSCLKEKMHADKLEMDIVVSLLVNL